MIVKFFLGAAIGVVGILTLVGLGVLAWIGDVIGGKR